MLIFLPQRKILSLSIFTYVWGLGPRIVDGYIGRSRYYSYESDTQTTSVYDCLRCGHISIYICYLYVSGQVVSPQNSIHIVPLGWSLLYT